MLPINAQAVAAAAAAAAACASEGYYRGSGGRVGPTHEVMRCSCWPFHCISASTCAWSSDPPPPAPPAPSTAPRITPALADCSSDITRCSRAAHETDPRQPHDTHPVSQTTTASAFGALPPPPSPTGNSSGGGGGGGGGCRPPTSHGPSSPLTLTMSRVVNPALTARIAAWWRAAVTEGSLRTQAGAVRRRGNDTPGSEREAGRHMPGDRVLPPPFYLPAADREVVKVRELAASQGHQGLVGGSGLALVVEGQEHVRAAGGAPLGSALDAADLRDGHKRPKEEEEEEEPRVRGRDRTRQQRGSQRRCTPHA
jgi:hypothetical protein